MVNYNIGDLTIPPLNSVFTLKSHLTCRNGDVYVGEFFKGKKHGNGRYIYSNGDVYEGEYFKNKRHGKGIYRFSNGSVYEGEFQDNLKSGRGIYKYRYSSLILWR